MTTTVASGLKVAKFGGSSVADAAQILKVCSIIKMDAQRRIVVVSAPGKRRSDDTKVTDMLIACAEAKLAGKSAEAELMAIVERYAEIQRAAGIGEGIIRKIEADLRQRLASDTSHRGRFLDLLKAAGEDNSAKLVAEIFIHNGVDAHYINPKEAGLFLSDDFGNALVLEESYAKLSTLKTAPGVSIFPGFFGYTKSGAVATFSRGGSDITGAILAAAVKAEVSENFTDVDSGFSADPRIVPNAAAIELLTYREMRELAYAGFGVFHDEAIVPAVKAGIPICIRNTNRPEAPGLATARENGITTVAIDHKHHLSREDFERAMQEVLEAHGIELVCLAGFMRILTPWFVERWTGRMINIHPALLPLYRGLHTHERALADGVKLQGASVHFVVPGMDEGPIIAQAAVPVLDGDTPDTLGARVLAQEHVIYPLALGLLAGGRLTIEGARVRINGEAAGTSALVAPQVG